MGTLKFQLPTVKIPEKRTSAPEKRTSANQSGHASSCKDFYAHGILNSSAQSTVENVPTKSKGNEIFIDESANKNLIADFNDAMLFESTMNDTNKEGMFYSLTLLFII